MSLIQTTIGNLRVAYDPTFTPAGYNNGKETQACLKFKGIVNTYQGIDPATGQPRPDKVSEFEFTLWGRRAESNAIWLSKGRQILMMIATPQTYDKRIFDANRNPILDAAGQPLVVKNHVGFRVDSIEWGNESQGLIDAEIAAGIRSQGYQIKNSAEAQRFSQMINLRKNLTFNPQLNVNGTQFGYARVFTPQGFQVNMEEYANQNPQSAEIQKQCFCVITDLGAQAAAPVMGAVNPVGITPNVMPANAGYQAPSAQPVYQAPVQAPINTVNAGQRLF